MEYRRVGRSGLKVSALSLGGWLEVKYTEPTDLKHVVHTALEQGVNFIDLADLYSHGQVESMYGQLLSHYPRHQLVLSSKCSWAMSQGVNDCGLSRKHIMESVHQTLKRLKTDYLDLFICHRFDVDTPLDETVMAMSDLIRQGKILYWGTSMWTASQLRQAHQIALRENAYAPIVEQPLYNLYEQGIHLELISTVRELGMGLTVWSPFAGGLLAGRSKENLLEATHSLPEFHQQSVQSWLHPWTDPLSQNQANAMFKIAQTYNVTSAQLALKWILKDQEISSVICQTSNPTHFQENAHVFSQSIPSEALNELDQIFSEKWI